MGDQQSERVLSVSANRRDVLKTAGGVVAASVVGGALFASVQESAMAKAASTIMMEIRDITGPGGFTVHSMSFGMSNPTTIGSGAGGGAGKASFSSVNIMKSLDQYTPLLQQASAVGKPVAEATLRFYDDKGTETGRMILRDVFVESIQLSISQSLADAVESTSFAFAGILLEYGGNRFEFNVAENR